MRPKIALIILLSAKLTASNISLAKKILSIEASNYSHRLSYLENYFTKNGWQLYLDSLEKSGLKESFLRDNLNLRAEIINENTLELSYDSDFYSYKQIVNVKLNTTNDKISSFATDIIKQSTPVIKNRRCHLKNS